MLRNSQAMSISGTYWVVFGAEQVADLSLLLGNFGGKAFGSIYDRSKCPLFGQ